MKLHGKNQQIEGPFKPLVEHAEAAQQSDAWVDMTGFEMVGINCHCGKFFTCRVDGGPLRCPHCGYVWATRFGSKELGA